MASRGNSSASLLIAFTLTAVTALALFITTVIFYGQTSKAKKDLEAAQAASREFLGGQTDLPWAARWQEQARTARQPVLAYMNASWEEMMRRTLGDGQATPEAFKSAVGSIPGADSAALTQVIGQLSRRIEGLDNQLADANEATAAARADLQSEVQRVSQLQTSHDSTIDAMNDQVGRYKGELDHFRTLVEETISENNERVDRIRRESANREATLQSRIAQLEEETLRLEGQLKSLRESQVASSLLPQDESSLVDGRIIGSDPAQSAVFIDLGRSDRVVLGMSFEVYSTSAAIRPDDDGNYPPGKATIEIIRINDGSSVARIVRESRSNPLVEGDVIANAVYDPKKVYHFVVFGNFDVDGDRIARPEEQGPIRGIITNWGGLLDEDITGRTDFLVLGERPYLPPEPPIDAPVPLIQQYIDLNKAIHEYDRLFESAIKASIPILNQNRLFTLTGLHAIR